MKRILCLMFVVLLALSSAVCCDAADADLSVQGKTVVTYGDWIIEKIDNDTRWNLDTYIGEGADVIVPRFIDDLLVVSIGHHCFNNNTNVKSVVTNSPLWTIEEYAFIGCSSLESFKCHYALKEIGVGAFSGTSSLTSINLQDSVLKSISDYAFTDSGLTEVELPKTCERIGSYAFARCGDLVKITIPESVTEISDTAFDACDNLVIYAKGDSFAIEYAIAHGIDYVITDAPVEITFMVGDADGDGAITILDATKIQRLLVSLITDDDGMIALRGDSNGNGLDILDATRIQRYLAGFTITEPIGEFTTVTVLHN